MSSQVSLTASSQQTLLRLRDLLLFLLVGVIGLCPAQSSSTSDAPWLHEACENPLLGRDGSFPPLSSYYYVDVYSTPSAAPDPGASQSGPQYEAIISLCNTTLKTPRSTKPCVLRKFFIGVWNSAGDCIGAYDQIMSTSEVANFNETGGSSFTFQFGSSVNATQSFTYTLRCRIGAMLGGADTSSFSPTNMLQVTGDLCPTVAPTSNGDGNNNNNNDEVDVKGKIVAGFVIPVAAGICVALGVGIGVLYMRRRRLPVPSAEPDDDATLG